MGQHRFVTTGLVYQIAKASCVATAGFDDPYPSRVSDYLSHTASARAAKC
jgi:hypothetical protein